MTLLICVTAIVMAIYFKPLIILRIKSKKVKVQYVSAEGKKVKAALYLTRDDPFWNLIKKHDSKKVGIMGETNSRILEVEKIKKLADSITNREPSEVRFYRHIALLATQKIRDLHFDFYLDGREPLLYQRENSRLVTFNGDVSDAYKACEKMIPDLGSGNCSGNYSTHFLPESWEPYEKEFFIEARFNCQYINNDHYAVTIRFNTKTVNWNKGTLEYG